VSLAELSMLCYDAWDNLFSNKSMARICDRCQRGSNRGNSRSHSNIATKRQQFANLQTKRIGGVRMSLCTRCLKTMDKILVAKKAQVKA